MTERLLIIEDEPLLGAELERYYQRKGWQTTRATSLAAARSLLVEAQIEPLVVLSDLSLPDGTALDLLGCLGERHGDGEWIFLTGFGGVRDAVRARQLGAFEFLEKPCPPARLDVAVSAAARSAVARRRLREQAERDAARFQAKAFVGRSAAASAIRMRLASLAHSAPDAILLTGEAGTGKTLAAHILHHAAGRGSQPLAILDCAAGSAAALESELFDSADDGPREATRRRRSLFEQAAGGSLFLRQVHCLAPDTQARLLHSLQAGDGDRPGDHPPGSAAVRVIAASDRDLPALVTAGAFHGGLCEHLRAQHLRLPPLRDRPGDLDDLVAHFLAGFNKALGKGVEHIAPDIWQALRAHHWPGNVRELRNRVECGVLRASDGHFAGAGLTADSADPRQFGDEPELAIPLDGSWSLEAVEGAVIERALRRCDGNLSAAARLLATTREKLRYRARKHGLSISNGSGHGPRPGRAADRDRKP